MPVQDNETQQEPYWKNFEVSCLAALAKAWEGQDDSAHDLAHIGRVSGMAQTLMKQEGGDPNVVMPAAWFHDLVNLPKDHANRSKASVLSAEEAIKILKKLGYDPQYFEGIAHAIEAHSFSANIPTRTIEAKILQDADRLDAVGAIGTARCFAVSGALGRPLLDAVDPLCKEREPDDGLFAVDHFFVKLFKLPETMKTDSGREMAKQRAIFMQDFLDRLEEEQRGLA